MVIVVLHQGSGNPQGPFMYPQIDPKIDPVRLILEDPCRLKALQSPSKVQIGHFIDLKTTDKLNNSTGFEVNWTSGYREIII